MRLVLHEPFSPFAHSIYEWKSRGESPILSVSHVHVDGFGRQSGLALVSEERFRAMLSALDDCPLQGGVDPGTDAEPAERRWARVEIREADIEWSAWWEGADVGTPDSCVARIRDSVEASVDIGEWENPYWTDGTFAMLRTSSTGPARVYIDGEETGRVTPLIDFRLEPGDHVVRWVSIATGEAREAPIHVTAGQTFSIDVELP